jgi:hypothetical protein
MRCCQYISNIFRVTYHGDDVEANFDGGVGLAIGVAFSSVQCELYVFLKYNDTELVDYFGPLHVADDCSHPPN